MDRFKSYFAPGQISKHRGGMRPNDEDDDEKAPDLPVIRALPADSSPTAFLRYNNGEFSNSYITGPSSHKIRDIKNNVMVNWLHQQQLEKLWATGGEPGEGVVLRMSKGNYTASPPELQDEANGFFSYVSKMNVRSAITVNTRVIKLFMAKHAADFVPLMNGLRLQVLPSLDYLPRCQKHQPGAFIQDLQILVVWDDEPQHLLTRALEIEDSLMAKIWGPGEEASLEDKIGKLSPNELEDLELEISDPYRTEPRETMIQTSVQVACTLIIMIATLSLGWRALAQQIAIDGSYLRLALLACVPVQMFVSLFFMQVIIANLLQIFGPVGQMNMNTRYYSGMAPRRLNPNFVKLPHITIQMPVYKESLDAVIKGTIYSIKDAISTYEMQGGSASIFVNDDGIRIIQDDEATERREFYEEHNIGWVARPPHEPDAEVPFIRRGKFKKASNMNYGLMISNLVEDKLAQIARGNDWNQDMEYAAYDRALAEVLEENGHAWAEGNIRIGDYILLIDSDTRVPTDCLLDAASEMEQAPEVGILQYSSGVMQVSDTYFENGITFFTNLIYTAIRYAIANGDVSPFVGHNAVLRWSAVQQVSYQDEDGYEKYWSESHVSEDFDMSLRLQIAGYTIRFGAYAGDGFKEGVSLTVYDELSRWEKYAFGCNELIFHPLYQWIYKGPCTPLFIAFLMSPIPISSKITNLAYIGNYYGIGCAWILTILNYFLMGWYNGYIDKYYLDSFKVYFSLIIVFAALGNVSLAVLRYRISERSFLSSFWENIKWLPLMTVFMGGISIHVFQAIASHALGLDMSWGATSKEVEEVTFFEELPRLIRRFKWTFLFCVTTAAGMGVFATIVPWNWRITEFTAIYPLCTVIFGHFMLPMVLNPALMLLAW